MPSLWSVSPVRPRPLKKSLTWCCSTIFIENLLVRHSQTARFYGIPRPKRKHLLRVGLAPGSRSIRANAVPIEPWSLLSRLNHGAIRQNSLTFSGGSNSAKSIERNLRHAKLREAAKHAGSVWWSGRFQRISVNQINRARNTCPNAHGPSYGGVWGLKSLGFEGPRVVWSVWVCVF